jgi:DNA-binding MarR family transcriptional regulator
MDYSVMKELPTEEHLRKLAARYPECNVQAVMALTRLLGTAGEIEKKIESDLSHHGLSLSRFYVLVILRRYIPEGIKPTELAEKISVTRGNMTGLLDGLEKSGLITREDCTKDRRIVFIKLSEAGEKLLDEIMPDHLGKIGEIMAQLGEQDLKKFTDNLEKIRAALVSIE